MSAHDFRLTALCGTTKVVNFSYTPNILENFYQKYYNCHYRYGKKHEFCRVGHFFGLKIIAIVVLLNEDKVLIANLSVGVFKTMLTIFTDTFHSVFNYSEFISSIENMSSPSPLSFLKYLSRSLVLPLLFIRAL